MLMRMCGGDAGGLRLLVRIARRGAEHTEVLIPTTRLVLGTYRSLSLHYIYEYFILSPKCNGVNFKNLPIPRRCDAELPWLLREGFLLLPPPPALNLAGTTLAAESRASKVITQEATTMKPPKPMTMGPTYAKLFRWKPLRSFFTRTVTFPRNSDPIER